MDNEPKITEDGYRIVEAPKKPVEKGIQCGVCGMKFDHGRAYGYYCTQINCPIQARST